MKKTFLMLSFLVLCAFLLRTYLLPSYLFFGPEQGKDFLVIRDIVISHKMTLIGPKTDLSGVFHGPIYYYLAAVPFFLSKGDPMRVMYFMIFLQALTVYPVFLLGKELTGKSRTGLVAALFFTVSFGLVVYARWLSGQPLTLPLVAFFYLGLIKFLKGYKWYLLLSAVSFGLSGQAEFINFLLLGVTAGCIVVFYHKTFFGKACVVTLISFAAALVVSLGNFVLFDLRHEFLITNSIRAALFGEGQSGSFFNSFLAASRTGLVVVRELCGLPYTWLGIPLVVCLAVCMWFFRKNKNLLLVGTGVVVPFFTLVFLRRGVLDQLYLPMLIPFLICLAYVIDRMYISKRYIGILLPVVFVFLNVYTILTCFPSNYRVFFQAPQPQVRYDDQLAVIRDIYRHADGKAFGIQSYTIPYFWQDGWIYLFWWQGTGRYGYIPKEENDGRLYVIIQKDRVNPGFQRDWYEKTVSQWGNLTYSFEKGEYRVEERLREKNQ